MDILATAVTRRHTDPCSCGASVLQLPMPKGFPPVWDLALHAGHYAGAVVGKSSWTYE
jgi:hypothetical protein